MHWENFTPWSTLVAVLATPLLPGAVVAGALEHPAPIRTITATAASGRSTLAVTSAASL
jgi:hypothetical protein